jgi:AcrR family transcriptional regulator
LNEARKGRRAEIGLKRRERTRRKLVEAAARVIAKRGTDDAKIDDFIAEADVSRSTFYNHFPTREDMIEALWSYVGKEPFFRINQTCAAFKDPATRIAIQLRLLTRQAEADATWGWLVFALSGQDRVNDDLKAYPIPDLLEGRKSGRFVFDDIIAARDIVIGMVRAILKARLERQVSDGYICEAGQMLLLALGVDAGDCAKLMEQKLPA